SIQPAFFSAALWMRCTPANPVSRSGTGLSWTWPFLSEVSPLGLMLAPPRVPVEQIPASGPALLLSGAGGQDGIRGPRVVWPGAGKLPHPQSALISLLRFV